MKWDRIKSFVVALLASVVLIWVSSQIDLLWNPWIAEANFAWWNMFTTQHYLAYLAATNPIMLAPFVIITALIGWATWEFWL